MPSQELIDWRIAQERKGLVFDGMCSKNGENILIVDIRFLAGLLVAVCVMCSLWLVGSLKMIELSGLELNQGNLKFEYVELIELRKVVQAGKFYLHLVFKKS
jgi:hypothetical protein